MKITIEVSISLTFISPLKKILVSVIYYLRYSEIKL